MDTDFLLLLLMYRRLVEGENKMNKTDITKLDYPLISDKLIDCLVRDFPDRLPRNFKNMYELGILIGQQQVIDKLKAEKQYNETKDLL